MAVRAAEATSKQALNSVAELEAAYSRHWDSVLRVCRRLLRDPLDAEDAAQETFIRVANRIQYLEGDPGAFLARTAHNLCVDELRRRARLAARQPMLEKRAVDASTDETEAEVVSSAVVRDLWSQMTLHERRLMAHHLAGYSYEETAHKTGLSAKSVSVGLVRARRRARRYLESIASLVGPWILGHLARIHRSRRAQVAGEQLAQVSPFGATSVVVAMMVLLSSALGSDRPDPGHVPATVSAHASAGPDTLAALASTFRPGPSPIAADNRSVAWLGGGGQGPIPIVQGILVPGQNAQQQDAQFTSLTPSPNYANDRTVYASGDRIAGCARPGGCPVVFRSTDGGATWTPLPAAGFAGGKILLPPSYPRDDTIFAAGPTGLEESRDGGQSFLLVAPVVGPAAISPDSKPGESTVLIGTQPLLIFDSKTRTLTVGPAEPAGTLPPDDVAYGADAGHILITTTQLNPTTGAQVSSVSTCGPTGICRVTATGAPNAIVLHLLISPSVAADGIVVAYSGSQVLVSHDMGQTFAAIAATLPQNLTAAGLIDSPSGARLLLGFSGGDASGGGPIEELSADLSRLLPLGISGLGGSVTIPAVRMLPDGRILAAVTLPTGGMPWGLRCSTDAGHSWQVAC